MFKSSNGSVAGRPKLSTLGRTRAVEAVLVVPVMEVCSSVTVESVLRWKRPPYCHTREGRREERGHTAPKSQPIAPMPDERI